MSGSDDRATLAQSFPAFTETFATFAGVVPALTRSERLSSRPAAVDSNWRSPSSTMSADAARSRAETSAAALTFNRPLRAQAALT
jgi:hypothetical protein